jgi:2-polyprenyl-6-methoxyphenol hydroxylase-like FAD-dependent oxidoreductase
MRVAPDVLIIGGGPVGCVAALAFARQGAEVVVLEARAANGRRLAGEWLHPLAVDALARLGVDLGSALPETARGRGFAVFPEDGSEPVLLPYDTGAEALSCAHQDLLSALRRAAASHPGIRFLSPARALAIAGQRVTFATGGSATETIEALSIVGADGHASLARRCLGATGAATPLSLMAGLLLEDVCLSYEGFGHVVLGGPGPALLFRIGPRRVRVCLDLPVGRKLSPAGLWSAFGDRLPASLQAAFRRALEREEVLWTANRRRARSLYGRPGLALVGDAVGQLHPLTAAGMTLGFLDAVALAASPDFASYREARSQASYVPEMLAHVLYEALGGRGSGAAALRQGLYRLWRQSPEERNRTLRLSSGQETRPQAFNGAFFVVLGQAAHSLLDGGGTVSGWPRALQSMGGLGLWLKWPLATVLRRGLRPEEG